MDRDAAHNAAGAHVAEMSDGAAELRRDAGGWFWAEEEGTISHECLTGDGDCPIPLTCVCPCGHRGLAATPVRARSAEGLMPPPAGH